MLILFLSILITVVKTSSTASQDISVQSKYLVNQKNKMKTKGRVQYYSNYITRYRTILSGKIEIDKVPCLSKSKSQVCDKTIIKKTCSQIYSKMLSL